MKPLYNKSETIECPGCDASLYIITRDLFKDEIFDANMFDALPGIKPLVNGDACDCPECGTCWASAWTGKIHIKGVGWC